MELLFEGSWEHIQKEMNTLLGHQVMTVTVNTNTAGAVPTISGVPEAKVEKPKVTKAAAAAAAAAQAPIVAPTAGGFDFKKIETIIPVALEAAGRGKVVSLLEKYGAKKGSELKSTDHEAFYNECKALVDGASLT